MSGEHPVNRGKKANQAGSGGNSGGSLRLRLTLLVLLTVVSAAGVGIVVDYLRERRLHIEGLFTSLEEQALALRLARSRLGDAKGFSRYADDLCRQMDAHTSPGHMILVLDPQNRPILSTLHHAGTQVRQALINIDAPRGILTLPDHRLAQVRVRSNDGALIVVAQYLDRVEDILAAQLLRRAFTVSIIVVALVVLLFFVMDTWVIKPVLRLSRSARAWREGEFSTRSEPGGPTELQTLANEFNAMASELEIVEAQREAELHRARRIQSNLLPSCLPSIPGLSVAAVYRPAQFVAGDLYDIFRLGDGRTAVLILDVAGHGVSAALLTGVVKMSLHRRLAEKKDPAEAVDAVNRDLLACATEGEFVTLCVGVWNHTERTWTYCAAGHAGGIFISDGRISFLPPTGALLGVLEDGEWTNRVLKLEDGDRIILYTDGVTDAGAPPDPMGDTGIKEVLKGGDNVALAGQMARIADDAFKRCSPLPCDDITMVGLEVLPGEQSGDYYVI